MAPGHRGGRSAAAGSRARVPAGSVRARGRNRAHEARAPGAHVRALPLFAGHRRRRARGSGVGAPRPRDARVAVSTGARVGHRQSGPALRLAAGARGEPAARLHGALGARRLDRSARRAHLHPLDPRQLRPRPRDGRAPRHGERTLAPARIGRRHARRAAPSRPDALYLHVAKLAFHNSDGALENASDRNNVVWTGSIDFTGLVGLAADRAGSRGWDPLLGAYLDFSRSCRRARTRRW